MPLDPNWLYSTLAQSTAAIVGLGGGFLIQRILQQRSEIATPRFDLLHNIRDAYQRVRDARQHAEQAASSLQSAADEGRRSKDQGNTTFRVTRDVFAYVHRNGGHGSLQGRGNGLPYDFPLSAIDRFADAAAAARDFAEALPENFEGYVRALEAAGGLDPGAAAWLNAELNSTTSAGTGDDFVDAAFSQRRHLQLWWRDLSAPATEAGDALRSFQAKLVPASFFWLLGLIAALLVIGTIIPLLYLSARSEASRALLVIPFTVLSLGFLGFVAAELRQLRAASDLSTETF